MTTDTIIRGAAGVVQVTDDLAWRPDHDWACRDTHVDGHLTDGTPLDVVTSHAHELPRSADVAARHSWLHGKVLTTHVGDHAAETLVVPTTELAPMVVVEAVRRRGYGHVEPLD